jgi:hypothetical protein
LQTLGPQSTRSPFEIDVLAQHTGAGLRAHPGFRAIQAIHGGGLVLAAVFVAEIGDVARFSRPQQLCSWAGLTPRHTRESDTKVHCGRITKQGNPLVRWATVEAVQGLAGHLRTGGVYAGRRLQPARACPMLDLREFAISEACFGANSSDAGIAKQSDDAWVQEPAPFVWPYPRRVIGDDSGNAG